VWHDQQNSIANLYEWRDAHETSVRELIAQEAAALAALTARADAASTSIRDLNGQIDRNGYRLAALEAKSPVVDETLKELQRILADQSGDLKVIREILLRLEKRP
jgi:chromosome segregation ATPase